MPNLFERIRNVFTDEMYSSGEVQGLATAAAEDARTYMAQNLIAGLEPVSQEELSILAVTNGANQEKLAHGLQRIKDELGTDNATLPEVGESSRYVINPIGIGLGKLPDAEECARDSSVGNAREFEVEDTITGEVLSRYRNGVNLYASRDLLPEIQGLTVDQAATLAVINNLSQRGQAIDPETLCREARHAGIYEGSAADLAANIHALREAGMIKFSAAGEPSSVDVTDSGRNVAAANADRTREELLAQLQDRRSELTEELERVIGSSRDAAAPGLAVPGFAEYLEAFNLLDQAELAVTSKVPLQISGDLMNEAAQVVEDYAADFAMAGITVDRTSEPKQDQKTEQKQEREQKQSARKPQMQFAQGMRM